MHNQFPLNWADLTLCFIALHKKGLFFSLQIKNDAVFDLPVIRMEIKQQGEQRVRDQLTTTALYDIVKGPDPCAERLSAQISNQPSDKGRKRRDVPPFCEVH